MNHAALRSLPLIATTGVLLAASSVPPKPDAATYQKSVEPLPAKYCIGCHNAKLKTGNLNLETYKDAPSALKDPDVFENVLQKLHAGVMSGPRCSVAADGEQRAIVRKVVAIGRLKNESASTRSAAPPCRGRRISRGHRPSRLST
jgi:hypothetical protein